MATRIRRPVNALLCMFSWKHLKTRLLQTNLCPPCVRTAKNRQWQCNVWHIVPAFSTRWQARLGVHFGLTTRFLSTPKTALLACGTNAVGLYERAGIAISARRYAFSAEIVVLSWEVPSENTCSRRIFYSELTVLATISIQNTVVRARLLVSSISHRVFLKEIVLLSLEVRQEIRARDVFSNQSSRFGRHFY